MSEPHTKNAFQIYQKQNLLEQMQFKHKGCVCIIIMVNFWNATSVSIWTDLLSYMIRGKKTSELIYFFFINFKLLRPIHTMPFSKKYRIKHELIKVIDSIFDYIPPNK